MYLSAFIPKIFAFSFRNLFVAFMSSLMSSPMPLPYQFCFSQNFEYIWGVVLFVVSPLLFHSLELYLPQSHIPHLWLFFLWWEPPTLVRQISDFGPICNAFATFYGIRHFVALNKTLWSTFHPIIQPIFTLYVIGLECKEFFYFSGFLIQRKYRIRVDDKYLDYLLCILNNFPIF